MVKMSNKMVSVKDLPFETEQGCYKWWASKKELVKLLPSLGLEFEQIREFLEEKNGFYCIYVGKSTNVRKRLICNHIDGSVRNSTFRRTIAGLMNYRKQCEQIINDEFIDKFKIEPIYGAFEKEKYYINEPMENSKETFFRILNSECNKHKLAKISKKKIKDAREKIKKMLKKKSK